MKTWDLILDDAALLEFFLPCEAQPWEVQADEIHDFKQVVKQHRIVFSDALMEILQSCYSETIVSLIQAGISSANSTSHITKLPDTDPCQTISEWLDMAMQNCPTDEWFIVYKESQSISTFKDRVSSDRIYTDKSAIEQCIANKIRRNTPNINVRVINGTPCDICAEWFAELFYNENVVTIFDQFFISKDGLDSFESYFAQSLSGKKIYLFTDLSEWEKLDQNDIDRWNRVAQSNGITITVFASRSGKKADEEHDRHLFLSKSIHITIGRSIDFLDHISRTARGTTISVFKDLITTPRSLQQEYNTRNVTAYQKMTTFPRRK